MRKIFLLSIAFIVISCARNNGDNTEFSFQSSKSKTEKTIEEPQSNNSGVQIENVNIYLENTLSMYGYIQSIKNNTNFRNTANELVKTSKNIYGKENVSFSLVNNEALESIALDGDNIDNINIGLLEKKFKKGRGSSDFDEIFKKVLSKNDENDVSIVIADFVYSPGDSDVKTGLIRFKQNIEAAFQNTKNAKDLGIQILHFNSEFDGVYYDINNDAIKGIENRPFYYIILGNNDLVDNYASKLIPELEEYQLLNDFQITAKDHQISDYSALTQTLNSGQFSIEGSLSGEKQLRKVLVNKATNSEPVLQLAISADLSKIPVKSAYLTNTENYDINNPNNLELLQVLEIENGKIVLNNGEEESVKLEDKKRIKNATHVFLVLLPEFYNGKINLSLHNTQPKWIEEVSLDTDDIDIKSKTKQNKTFGFSYMVSGMYEAIQKNNQTGNYFEISLGVGQEGTGSQFSGLLIGLVVLCIVGLIIFIIIKNKQRK
jgi:hypothetical protein